MDYKISQQIDNEDGGTLVTVSFYDGAVTTEDEYSHETRQMEPVTRYRRTEKLETVEYEFDADEIIAT